MSADFFVYLTNSYKKTECFIFVGTNVPFSEFIGLASAVALKTFIDESLK